MNSESIVGRLVEIPVDSANTVQGIVISEQNDGLILVEDCDGEKWKGWEYQARLLTGKSEAM